MWPTPQFLGVLGDAGPRVKKRSMSAPSGYIFSRQVVDVELGVP